MKTGLSPSASSLSRLGSTARIIVELRAANGQRPEA